VELCDSYGATFLVIDGPQAWKAPSNGVEHSRLCERLLNTPAKTGLPGSVKPKSYTTFVAFSVSVFDELHRLGIARFDAEGRKHANVPAAVESFPLAAWRRVGIAPLPAKNRATAADIDSHLEELCLSQNVAAKEQPTHDQLQALVGGLAAAALELRAPGVVEMSGLPPRLEGGFWREGYITVPRGTAGFATGEGSA
jgi:hypothetical protein